MNIICPFRISVSGYGTYFIHNSFFFVMVIASRICKRFLTEHALLPHGG